MNSIKKTIVFALTGALAMSLLSGCGKETLDGTKTVAIVDGEELPLGVLSLYARQQQAMYENFYQAYMGSTPGWDNVVDEETNQTYGEQMVQTSLDTIEEMMLLKAKAADYGVEISDEDRENIKKAAEEFMAANSEETIKELSITQEQVETYLELQTYQTRMYDAVRAAAEVEITDEQATQSTFSYVSITVENQDAEATEETTEEIEEAAEETEEAAEEAAEETEEVAEEETEEVAEETEEVTEEATEEAAEETEETAEETTETNGLEDAQKILDQMIADPTADMDEIAKSVNDTYSGLTGHYTKSADVEDSESDYPEEVLSVLRELKDGEVYDQLVQVEDTVYVLRKDLDVDEDETETKRQSLDDAARSDAYTNLLQEWEDNATITVDDKVLGTLEITDSHTFTYAVTEEEEEAEEAVGDPEDAVDVTEEAAEETAEDAVEEITVEDSEEEATEDTAEETTEETETIEETAEETTEE